MGYEMKRNGLNLNEDDSMLFNQLQHAILTKIRFFV